MQYATKRQNKRHFGKWLIVVVIILVLAAGGGFWWHHTHPVAKKIQTNTGTAIANPNVPGSTDNKESTNVTPGAIGGPTNSKDYNSNVPGQTTSGVQPNRPIGQFVSNPGGPGNPNPTTEESTCTTTPGAFCQILFKSGGVTNQLPAQKTDANGSTVWDWGIKAIGLTPGTWQVTAVATNGDKSASNTGPQLVISR